MRHSVVRSHEINYMQEKDVPAFYAEGLQPIPSLKIQIYFYFFSK